LLYRTDPQELVLLCRMSREKHLPEVTVIMEDVVEMASAFTSIKVRPCFNFKR
jgi:hypothetical protein